MVAVVYVMIIIFDFMVAPIMWSILQWIASGDVVSQWVPLTATSGGLFHAAMGGIIGASAFTRGQEKVERIKAEGKFDDIERGI